MFNILNSPCFLKLGFFFSIHLVLTFQVLRDYCPKKKKTMTNRNLRPFLIINRIIHFNFNKTSKIQHIDDKLRTSYNNELNFQLFDILRYYFLLIKSKYNKHDVDNRKNKNKTGNSGDNKYNYDNRIIVI